MAQHNELGKIGEQIAARYLYQQGYTMLEKDYRVGHKDIDIIACKDGVVVFVEVKTRSSDRFGSPEEAVDKTKVRNLLSAANAYIRRKHITSPVRFDVIGVVGTEEPFQITHFAGAFNPLSLP